MNRVYSCRALVALLLSGVLCCSCLPTTPPDGKASLQALQTQGAASPADSPPLQTNLDPEEQGRFRLDYAKLLMDGGRDDEAEGLLDKLRYNDKLAPEAYPLLAKIYERKNMPGEALVAWKKALSLRPGDPVLMGRVARAALVGKEYAVAEGIFKQWLADNPVGSKLYIAGLNNLGFSGLLQQRYEQAAGFLDQAIALDPLNKRARANLALLDRARKKGAAVVAPELSPETSLLAGEPVPLEKQKGDGVMVPAPIVNAETGVLPVLSVSPDKQKKKKLTFMAQNPRPETGLASAAPLPVDKQQGKGLADMTSNPDPALRVLRVVPPPLNKQDEGSGTSLSPDDSTPPQ